MTATAAAATEHTDFRHILIAGAKTGAMTAGAVVAYLAVFRSLEAGMPRSGILALLTLAAGVAASFLPARWVGARSTEGVASAAGAGLFGTVVFMAIDIIVLRPVKAYPWTWDAIGGDSSWWYLPIWWMLGTFLAWMGAIITARSASAAGILRLAAPVVIGAVVLVSAARLSGLVFLLPFQTGLAYTGLLGLAAVVALVRKS